MEAQRRQDARVALARLFVYVQRREAAIRYAVAYSQQQARRLGDYTSWSDWPLWRCTAYHESGGLFWTNEAGPFAGAFDIARTTWRAYAGEYAQRWPDAGTAPPWAQILGARLVRARVGSSLWGGLRACGG